MAEIIAFPSPQPSYEVLREQALERFAEKVAAHMSKLLYQKNILDVPVQWFVRGMYENMLHDGFAYEPATLDWMGDDPDTLFRLSQQFMTSMVRHGHIPPDAI